MLSFKHSGSLGDLIYSLPAVRALGGGVMYVNKDGFWTEGTSDPVRLLRRLILAQPYLHDVREWAGERVDYDLDGFRRAITGFGWCRFLNIADSVLMLTGMAPSERDRPWLTVPPVDGFHVRLLVHVGRRWRGCSFNWSKLISERGPAVFVGTAKEHADFEAAHCKIDYLPTADLYELAQLIAAADRFAGTQSCPYAIAEAMKRPATLEVGVDIPNALFHRSGLEKYMVY